MHDASRSGNMCGWKGLAGDASQRTLSLSSQWSACPPMGCGEVKCDCAPPRAALLVELKRPAPGTVTVCRGDVCESAPINGTDGSADEADITVDELGSVRDLAGQPLRFEITGCNESSAILVARPTRHSNCCGDYHRVSL